MRVPLGYFLTFSTYGLRLPGDPRGWTDHLRFSSRALAQAPEPDPVLQGYAASRRTHRSVALDGACRGVVATSLREVCDHYGWPLHGYAVASDHVHIVLSAPVGPRRVITALKAWATRRLVETGYLPAGSRVWARGGWCVTLHEPWRLARAVHYTIVTNAGAGVVTAYG